MYDQMLLVTIQFILEYIREKKLYACVCFYAFADKKPNFYYLRFSWKATSFIPLSFTILSCDHMHMTISTNNPLL